MKRNFITIFSLLTVGILACKKEKDTTTPTSVPIKIKDSIYAKINGKSWPGDYKSNTWAVEDGGNDISLNMYIYSKSDSMLIQSWGLYGLDVATLQKNIYAFVAKPAKDKSYVSFALNEGDGTYNRYTVWENATVPNQVVIDDYDASSKRIKGHFNFSMYRSDGDNRTALYGFADTLRFTDGYFDVEIK